MTGNKRPVIVLQERDRRLLEELGTLRVIDREQAKVVAGFNSTRRANARLLALTQAGFLKRISLGSSELTAYMLAGTTISQTAAIPATLFTKHQLAINSIYLMVGYPRAPLAGASLLRWLRFGDTLSKTLPLIPDSYFEFNSAGNIRPMFLEVDLGTEALPIWQKKTRLYLHLALSGEFQKIFGQSQFRVLVILNTDVRMNHIRSTVAKITEKLFWFSTFEAIHREGLWAPIWFRPQGDRRHSLI
jgi:hypothetical protein